MKRRQALPDENALRHSDTGQVLLAVLAQGRHAARMSLLLIVAAIVLLAAAVLRTPLDADWSAGWRNAPAAALWLSVLIGMVQRYYALRVRLDVQLFAQLYARPAVDDQDLNRLDAGLALLGAPSTDAAPRGLRDRWTGALRLLGRQLMCCGLQTVCLLAAGGLAWL
ncbi:hypothetical protein [Bordetella sp. N]|uniref:hypothetical protein n=1 Tax=Bordetella sp. N TaxID=1746199 RepID=UPI00070B4D49|nr:hypothetical protein [Bordetella sp. N]ALM84870.1 hypothetical protein ASB57_19505 [Bordetella sp. N]